MAKPVIKYKSFMGKDPRTDEPRLGVTITDRVVKHTEEMAEALIKGGYAIGIQKSLLVGIINALADYFVDALNEGQTLLIDNRLSIRLDLVGQPNEDGSLGSRNEVKVNAIPLNETKKVTKDSFSWERVNDDGATPKFDYLISDATGAKRGKLVENADVLATGKNLLPPDDATDRTLKWVWKNAKGERQELGTQPMVWESDLVKCVFPASVKDVVKPGDELMFELSYTTAQGTTKTASVAATFA